MSPQPPMGDGIDDRRTPPELIARLNALYDFTLDGAASHENALFDRYCTIDGTYLKTADAARPHCIDARDGLTYPWAGQRVYINPPYGRGLLAPFVRKAFLESEINSALIVALLPARVEQAWFHTHVLAAGARIEWLRRRVKYDGLKAGAPFPSMIVIWGDK